MPQQQPAPKRSRAVWLGPIAAVLVISLIGAIGLTVLRKIGGNEAQSTVADTRGYRGVENLCDVADFSAFGPTGFSFGAPDSTPTNDSTLTQSAAIDIAGCDRDYRKGDALGFLNLKYAVHKQVDPIPEFRAGIERSAQQPPGRAELEVAPVSGLGDEAYSTYDPTGRSMSLTVRDGWLILEVSWSCNISVVDNSSDLDKGGKLTLLTSIARGTLPKLRS